MEHVSQLLQYPALISHFTGSGNYSVIHLQQGQPLLLAKSLVYFEQCLPSFLRLHKSVLVNPTFIESTQFRARPKRTGQVIMKDGTTLSVSRRRWSELSRLLGHNEPATTTLQALPNNTLQKPSTAVSTTPVVMVIMEMSTGLLAQDYLEELGSECLLHPIDKGAGLANSFLLDPSSTYPVLILLDAHTNRPDRLLTLRAFKSHPALRSIPIIWLAGPTDDLTQVYSLEANSVIVIYNNKASLRQALKRLCRYWLTVVELPRPSNCQPTEAGRY